MFRMGAKTKQSLEQGFGDPYTISIVRNTRNSTSNHLGPYVTPCYGGLDPFRVPRTVKQGCFGLLGQIFITAYLIYHIAPKTLKNFNRNKMVELAHLGHGCLAISGSSSAAFSAAGVLCLRLFVGSFLARTLNSQLKVGFWRLGFRHCAVLG